ncbi:hypothetical protein AKJ37_02150 [candidate division MSBL1 archaeon SCGC-AAA259I09]|uniref:GYF domain-containing protein n=2 Tax=candidate division MSBL1 TaxID=215777 RepID=A0A133UUF6_9EURY|nr:hypothetical protein AKJ62_02000 [candidate division MSBL1 archaeon SCGC-AAA259D14]KXA97848.1 hypothetical protein AKJ37_02150 [candidate division MSBL1 archaeon SCGC-AAA259I09]
MKFVRNTGCEPDFLELEVGGLQIKSSRRANPFLYFQEIYYGSRMVKGQLKRNRGGKIFSPLTRERIERWIDEERVEEDHLVWRPGYSAWRKVSETEEFGHLFE